MSFVKDSISVFSTRVLILAVGIGQGIIIARVLGPTGKGVLSISMLLPSLLISAGHLGIGNANLYFIGRRKFSLQSILSNSLILSIIIGGFLILSCLVSVAVLRDNVFEAVGLNLIVLAALTIPFALLVKYAGYIFLGSQMITERNLVEIFRALSTFALIIPFVAFLRSGVEGALVSILCGLLTGTFYSLLRLRRIAHLSVGFDYDLFKKSVRYGLKPYFAMLILSLNYRSNLLLVKYFLTNTDVGHYSLAVSIADMLWHIPRSIGIITYSRVASLSPDQANDLTPRVCRNTLLVSLIVGIVMFCTAKFFITLVYGQAYMPSVNAFMFLLPGTAAMAIFMVLHSDLAGRGHPEITIYIFSAALVLNIILNLILIPKMRIEGAALASTVSYVAGSVALAYVFSRLTNTRFTKLLLLQRADIQDYCRASARLKSKILG